MLVVAVVAATTAPCVNADVNLTLTDYLHHTWTNELVTFEVATAKLPGVKTVALFGPDEKQIPVQSTRVGKGKVAVSFIVGELPADATRVYSLRQGKPLGTALLKDEDATAVMDSGVVAVRVPTRTEKRFDPPIPLTETPPPLLAVRGVTRQWIGNGRLAGGVGVKSMKTTFVETGPVYAEVKTDYILTTGTYSMTVRVVAGQDAVLVSEEFDSGTDAVNNAYFQFSAKENLQPARTAVQGRLWRERKEKKDSPAGTDYALEFDQDRREVSVIGYVTWWPETTRVITLYGASSPDTLSFFPRRVGEWRNPMGSYLETRKDGEVFLSLPLYVDQEWTRDGMDRKSPYYTGRLEKDWPETACRRKWAFFLSTKERVLPESGRSALQDAVIQHSDLPLDKIKDWVLEWNGDGVTYPRLYVEPGKLEDVRRRALATPGWDTELRRYYTRPETYVLTQDVKVGDELLREPLGQPNSFAVVGASPAQRQYVAMLFDNWGYVGFPAPNQARPMIEFVRFDAAMSVKGATDTEREEMRRLCAFVAQMVYDQDWHPTLAGWHLGNPNMPPRQEHHLAVAGSALPTHPLAKQWRARGEAEQKRLIDAMTRPSGAWRECPHYQWEAAMYPMFQAAVPLKLSGGYDLFADPKVKKTWDYLVGILMPPDPRFQSNGKRLRTQPAFGNGSWEFMPLLGWLAAMTKDTDPAFSQRMMWAWKEQGSPHYSHMSELIIDPNLPAKQPDLKSANYRGFGCTLRSGFPSDEETWMAFRHGDCIEHYNYGDQGSFMLCAKGSPLVLHFGSQYTPYLQGSWYFNRASVNHRLINDEDPSAQHLGGNPKDYALGTELWCEDGSNDYVMHNKGFVSFDGADYAHAEQVQQRQGVIGKDHTIQLPPNTPLLQVDIPDTTWIRRVLFLKDKDPLAPNYFLIRDDFISEQPLAGEWNIWTLADNIETQENRVKVVGKYGVDMDVFMAAPVTPQWSTRQETNKFIAGPSHQYLIEKPWIEVLTNLRAQQTPGKGFLAVLYPRKCAEKAPTFEAIADGKGVKVATPRGTDWAFLSHTPIEWKGDGLSFSGTAGAIRKVGDQYEVIFTEPGEAIVNGKKITAREAMEKRVKGN